MNTKGCCGNVCMYVAVEKRKEKRNYDITITRAGVEIKLVSIRIITSKLTVMQAGCKRCAPARVDI